MNIHNNARATPHSRLRRVIVAKQPRQKVGEVTMETELLREKIARLEAGAPLARRRSRR